MITPDYFVLFADMLGFKQLVLRHKVPFPKHLDFRDRAFMGTLASASNVGNPLGDAFTAFHGGIELTVNNSSWSTQCTLIVFSDSLFLASTSWHECLSFAERLMTYCMGQEVPMRMGIGHGSFVPYGLAFEERPRFKLFSSQFFGTGVIYAVEAEKHLKGLRIALHKSATEALLQPSDAFSMPLHPYKTLALPVYERSAEITHEWNYLGAWNDYTNSYSHQVADQATNRTLLMHINKMQEHSPKDPDIGTLYSRTKAAFQRMTEAIAATGPTPGDSSK
jgi:hypothetical protein